MTTIFWAGDSTVRQNSIHTYPQTGIGQVFDRFTRRYQVEIANYAENGRSTKSFLEDGRLAPICHRIQKGDFLFIQFGHNVQNGDEPARYAPADTTYTENLRKFIDAARSREAVPVLITPLTRCNFHDLPEGQQHGPWADAMRRLARELDVALIDLTRMSEELVDSYGPAAAAGLYMTLPAGKYPHFPDGLTDRTHLQPLGAMTFGALVAKGLYQLGGVYADLLSDEYEAWMENGCPVLP